MSAATRFGTLVMVLSAAAAGFWISDRGLIDAIRLTADPTATAAADARGTGPTPSGAIVYYRSPDGPSYSAKPTTTADGRPFVPVHAGEEIRLGPEVPQAEDSSNVNDDRKVLYYRHPMGLPDTSPVPKKDSMGMDYIPVYEGEASDGSVSVPIGKRQLLGVRSEAAAMRPIVSDLRLPARVSVDERRVSVVSTRIEAYVEKVHPVTTGDSVLKGEPLLDLYSADVATAASQLLLDRGGDSKGRAGARRRLMNLGVPEAAIDQIDKEGRVPGAITWTASGDGLVLERNVAPGMKVSAGDVLFRIADLSRVWLIASVPESQVGDVKQGAPVLVRSRGAPEELVKARIDLIYPSVSPETRTVDIRIELENPDRTLLPGMLAEVELSREGAPERLSVAESAVIDTGNRQLVLLDLGEGRFAPRDVTAGLRGGGFVEILGGLSAGDQVVVSANFLIDAESNLKSALGALAGATP